MEERARSFERTAHLSEAVEAGRLASPWHRRFVWGLGLVCWSLWAAVFFIAWGSGFGLFLVLPAVLAAVDTALFLQLLMRMREADRAHAEGRPVRFRRG